MYFHTWTAAINSESFFKSPFHFQGDFLVLPGCLSHPPGATPVTLSFSSPLVQPEFHVQTLTVKLKTLCPLPTPKVNMAHESSQKEQLGIKFSFEDPLLLSELDNLFCQNLRTNTFPSKTLFVGNKYMDLLLAGKHINDHTNVAASHTSLVIGALKKALFFTSFHTIWYKSHSWCCFQ